MKNLISMLLLVFSFTLGTAQSKVQNKQEVKKEVQNKTHRRNTILNKKIPLLSSLHLQKN